MNLTSKQKVLCAQFAGVVFFGYIGVKIYNSIPEELPLTQYTSQSPEVKAVCPEIDNVKLKTVSLHDIDVDIISEKNTVAVAAYISKSNDHKGHITDLFQKLDTAEEGDYIRIVINSRGGNISRLDDFNARVDKSMATTVTFVRSTASSAALNFFLDSGDTGNLKPDAKLISHGRRIKEHVANAYGNSATGNSLRKLNEIARENMQERSEINGHQLSYECVTIFNSDDNIDVEILAGDMPKLFPKIYVINFETKEVTFRADQALPTPLVL